MTIQLLTVAAAEGETRLDRWFRRHYPQLTQGALQKLLRTGQIRVDGKRAEANTRVIPGQEIRVPPIPAGPAPQKPAQQVSERDARELEQMVLYRDDSVIVLNKPHGLPVQGGPGIKKHLDGMLDALRFGNESRPKLVHRLDRDTSGVLLLARTPAAAAKLAAAFRSRHAEKTYWAVVVGRPEHPGGRIDMPLVRLGGPRGERTAPAGEGDDGATAITEYDTLDGAQRRVTLLEMRPLTGRTHQLRVHAADALGCPILGDGKYGGEDAHHADLPPLLHLHARALRLPHPEGGMLEVAAPLPPHMRETFKFFGFEEQRAPKPRRLATAGAKPR